MKSFKVIFGSLILAVLLITQSFALSGSTDEAINGQWTFEKPTKFKSTIDVESPKVTPAAVRNGLTVHQNGRMGGTFVYKVTLSKEAFYAAAVTNDVTIATLPAKTIVHSVIATVDTPFVCSATCTTGTLSAVLGITAAGVEFLESFDLDNAAATFGDADAEVGSKLDVAGGTNGGYPLWAATTVIMRATSGTGNWGNATTTNLSAGQVTFYILYSAFP